jgi:ornithine carrier protein
VRLQALQIAGVPTPSPSELFRQISEREGVRALFRGMSLPLAGTVLETATLFLTNGYLKRSLAELGHIGPGDNLPMPYVLLAGAGTGFVVSFVLTPIELVKCRLQISHDASNLGRPKVPYTGAIDCVRRSVREEGLRVMYRGHTGTIHASGGSRSRHVGHTAGGPSCDRIISCMMHGAQKKSANQRRPATLRR